MNSYKDKEWLKKKYSIEGLNTYEIANICDCSNGTIGRWLRRYNISIRNKSEILLLRYSKIDKLYKNKSWLYQKYINEELTLREIGNLSGCKRGIVYYWLKKYNIIRRSTSEALLLHFSKVDRKCKNKEWLYRKYCIEGLTTYKISKLSKTNHNTISKLLKMYNIPIQTQSERMMGKKNHFYGKHHTKEARRNIGYGNTDIDFLLSTGGKYTRSTYPYSKCFKTLLKKQVRELYDNKCVVTGMTNEEHKEKYGCSLHIHHWTYNKDETNPFYFVPVTQSINSQANANHSQWRDMFWGIAEDKYCEMMKNE